MTAEQMAEAVVAGLRWDFDRYDRVVMCKDVLPLNPTLAFSEQRRDMDSFVVTEVPKWLHGGPDRPVAGEMFDWRHHMDADLIFVDGVSIKDRLQEIGRQL